MKMLASKCGGAFDLPDKLAEKLQSVRARSVAYSEIVIGGRYGCSCDGGL